MVNYLNNAGEKDYSYVLPKLFDAYDATNGLLYELRWEVDITECIKAVRTKEKKHICFVLEDLITENLYFIGSTKVIPIGLSDSYNAVKKSLEALRNEK